MDIDYRIWFHGRVIDDKLVSKSRRKFGFENWDHELPIKTTKWQIGKIYEYEKIITVNSGQYDLVFGLWNTQKDPKTGEVYRLYPSVNIGRTQIK
jgi:hypothetical protein